MITINIDLASVANCQAFGNGISMDLFCIPPYMCEKGDPGACIHIAPVLPCCVVVHSVYSNMGQMASNSNLTT